MQMLSCAEMEGLIAQGGQLLDVRTPMEFYQGALPGAVNIPLQAINTAIDTLDRKKPVLVYCRSGSRSATARLWLHAMGFENVVDMGTSHAYVRCLAQAKGGSELRQAYARAS